MHHSQHSTFASSHSSVTFLTRTVRNNVVLSDFHMLKCWNITFMMLKTRLSGRELTCITWTWCMSTKTAYWLFIFIIKTIVVIIITIIYYLLPFWQEQPQIGPGRPPRWVCWEDLLQGHVTQSASEPLGQLPAELPQDWPAALPLLLAPHPSPCWSCPAAMTHWF